MFESELLTDIVVVCGGCLLTTPEWCLLFNEPLLCFNRDVLEVRGKLVLPVLLLKTLAVSGKFVLPEK